MDGGKQYHVKETNPDRNILISLLISRRSSFYDYMVIWYINIIADFKSTIYIIQLLLH